DPADPSWIPGMCDNGDYDDVVSTVTDGTGVSDSRAPWRSECIAQVIQLYAVTEQRPSAPVLRPIIRGPPSEAFESFSARPDRSRNAEVPVRVSTASFHLALIQAPRLTCGVAAPALRLVPIRQSTSRYT